VITTEIARVLGAAPMVALHRPGARFPYRAARRWRCATATASLTAGVVAKQMPTEWLAEIVAWDSAR
jgi:hypothetical protein